MKKELIILLFLIITLFFSCKRSNFNEQKPELTNKIESVNQLKSNYGDQLLMAVLWYQKSAEMRALAYQSYNLAYYALEKNLALLKPVEKPAIILDIDETVFDNSPFEAFMIKNSKIFDASVWTQWTKKCDARAIAGAVDFLNYAKKRGVEIFYISNRKKEIELTATLNNLKSQGFPNAEEKYALLKENEKSKEGRRKFIGKEYTIILLLGDNLVDFSNIFEQRGKDFGFDLVDKHKDDFGSIFIILPNPMYGDWEDAIYEYKENLTEEQKDSIRRSVLKYFEGIDTTIAFQ
ncbi:MAG: 5'-nucleotidase, lipoprotein e(P4) family [Bacteroidia bacterium]|nr:5'-nucleotidase, lipoprotein e(P4) family [Bacteroidia bacterium]